MIRVRTLPLSVAVIILLIGGVYVSKATGNWKTTSTKEPAKFKTGELAGLPNPSDIRGSYTWLDIEKAFGISAVEAAAAFSAPGFVLDVAGRINALETYYKERLPADKEVGTDSVRLFVSRLTGLPHESEEGTALPVAALAYLESKGKADDETRAAAVDVSAAVQAAPPASAPPAAPAATASAAPNAAPAPATAPKEDSAAVPAAAPAPTAKPAPTAAVEHDAAERKVGGSTTFGDLYAWGLSEAEVAGATGFKNGAPTAVVRDAAQASGGSFSAIKDKLQKLVDAKAK